VSGSGQTGDLSAALAAPLIVQVLDGANRPVSGAAVTWTVTGGGSVSPATATTTSDGNASTTWTLGPTPGLQAATATTAQVSAGSVSFLASTGATIIGNVTLSSGSTTNIAAAQAETRTRRALAAMSSTRQQAGPSARPNRIVVGFRSGTLGVAAAGASAYRSMTTARATAATIQQRLSGIMQRHPVSDAQISPVILAARLRVADTANVDRVMDALRSDPDIAWAERDAVVTIRDGAPRPVAVRAGPVRSGASPAQGVTTKLPNDPNFYVQYWHYNLLDLPRAWGITTGSPSVIVAVVDMGIRFDHPDIAANLTNDGYDFVSQVGYGSTQNLCAGGTFDTIDGDGDGPDPDPTDPDDLFFDSDNDCWVSTTLGDHGLWTAGIVGSVGNDGVGGTGTAWSVKIRPVRVLGMTGDGTAFDVAQGVLYSAGLPASGANKALVQAPSKAPIISISLGSSGQDSTERAAVAAAVAAGSLIVASAGNGTSDFRSFPAGYPSVMAVVAVGQDGELASYSNAGSWISVAAPGGEFRLDDNGGGGVIGPGWDFINKRATYLSGYGTSASAPHVAGVAALLLAQTPGLTATDLRTRIEQFAARPPGTTRNDTFGWGIVNAYNSLTQRNGPARQAIVRLIDPVSGAVVKTVTASASGAFSFTRLTPANYLIQAGEDESGDGLIGVPGRRFGWAGTFAAPTSFTIAANQIQNVAVSVGYPTETEPNDDAASANTLSVNSYIVGQITTPDPRDIYKVVIPAAGQYTFETSGLVGSCGWGIELDTVLSLQTGAGAAVSTNDNFQSAISVACSRITSTLAVGTYNIIVTGTAGNGLSPRGRYRLEVRSGP
jgi:subtilisin family serine protease